VKPSSSCNVVLIFWIGNGRLTIHLLSSLKSDIVRTVTSFFGMINVGEACTSNYNAYDRDNNDNDSDINNETMNEGGDNDSCDDLNGKQPRQSKIYRL
jgi:hypothetical protein